MPESGFPGELIRVGVHCRSAPRDLATCKTRRSGSKSGSGQWSHWDDIGWVHYPEIGWSHSDEIRWVQSLEILHPPNHPWPIILFSTQEFKLTGAGNVSLVLLAELEYKKLEEITDVQPCSATLPPQYRGGGRITEYDKGNARICWLSQIDACKYLTAISTSPDIHWTAEQSKLIHGLSWDTECKDSGWWEYQEKFRHDAEAWAKSHPDDSNQTNR
jgi:hypothetical protein